MTVNESYDLEKGAPGDVTEYLFTLAQYAEILKLLGEDNVAQTQPDGPMINMEVHPNSLHILHLNGL